jgi:precorrin-4 methylase
MKRPLVAFIFISVFTCYFCVPGAHALSIGGLVRQPLNLSTEDLANLSQSEIRFAEVSRGGRFSGHFVYRGVSLRALLQLATIQKEVAGFSKSIDLAIVLSNKEGQKVVLSWGEVFYRNAADVIIATSAVPVTPHAAGRCGQCHGAEVFQPALDQLGRKIGFPRLVTSGDFFADRCLENVTHIEIVEPGKAQEKKEERKAGQFTIVNSKGQSTSFKSLAGYPRVSVTMKEIGSGKGYHGIKHYEGVSLRDLLKKTEGDEKIDRVAVVTSTDGYRSLVSFGELFLSSLGERVIITDHAQGKTLPKDKKFSLVVPDDALSDREVKTVSKIEVIPLTPAPKVYIIGVGCGDTGLITLEAISYMGKAGAFVASGNFAERFSKYIGNKPVLFDPFTNWEPVYKKNHPGLSDEEVKKRTTELRKAEIQSIRDMLKAGKSVAVLEPGDPTIYGGWENWLLPEFAGQIEIITGINSFSAANAMLGGNIASNRNSMVLTTPWAIEANEDLVRTVAKSGDIMAIFMGFRELKKIESILKKHYSPTAPMTIVYKAGIAKEKYLVRTDLGHLVETASKEGERFLGLIYIGTDRKEFIDR